MAGAQGIAVTAARVYFTAYAMGGGGVYFTSPDGGLPIELAAPGQTDDDGMAMDENNVYWVSADPTHGFVASSPIGSSVVNFLVGPPSSAANYSSSVAVNAGSLFWLNQNEVVQGSLDGGALTAIAVGASPSNNPQQITATGGAVYWTNGSAIMSVPLDGGAVSQFAAGNHPVAVARDAEYLYWDNSDGSLVKAPLAGGAPVTLAGPSTLLQAPVGGVAVDSRYVYWGGGALIFYAPLSGVPDGGAAGWLFNGSSDTHQAIALVVDSAHLYWTDGVAGAVYRTNLPP